MGLELRPIPALIRRVARPHLDRSREALRSFESVADGGVIATIVEAPDDGRAPTAHMLREIHGNLTIEAGGLRLPQAAPRTEPGGHRSVYLR